MYKHVNCDPWKLSLPKINGLLTWHIWYTYNLYTLLDCISLQWAVPKKLLKFLNSEYGCDTELFASPINAYYRNYYSLFSSDEVFCSSGNFFAASDENFLFGCFHVNPPFINEIFVETVKKIMKYLEIAEKNGNKLTFFVVLPDWKDCSSLEGLLSSKWTLKTIFLDADSHNYFQHNYNNYVDVHFNTYFIALSTDTNMFIDEPMIRKLFVNDHALIV